MLCVEPGVVRFSCRRLKRVVVHPARSMAPSVLPWASVARVYPLVAEAPAWRWAVAVVCRWAVGAPVWLWVEPAYQSGRTGLAPALAASPLAYQSGRNWVGSGTGCITVGVSVG